MKPFLRNALAVLVVATAGLGASAQAATAGDLSFDFRIGGPGGGVIIRDHGRHGGWDRFERHRDWDRFERRRDRGYCKPRRALRKARRMGLRHTDIVRANHRKVVVEGYRHHRPVRVVFANQHRCPVIRVRR